MFTSTVKELIKVAKQAGITFQWIENLPQGAIGRYLERSISIKKGLTEQQAQEVIVHELAHAFWLLSLSTGSRKRFKDMRCSLAKAAWISLKYPYNMWEEESFAYYMEDKPDRLLTMFKTMVK